MIETNGINPHVDDHGGAGNWLVYTYTLYDLSDVNDVQMVWPGVSDGGQTFSPELGNVDIYGPAV